MGSSCQHGSYLSVLLSYINKALAEMSYNLACLQSK